MNKLVIIIVFFSCTAISKASTTVPFTLEDRDRLIRLEQRMDALERTMDARFAAQDAKFTTMDAKFTAMDAKFDSLQGQINDVKTLMYFVLGGMLGLVGFILWDRRTFLKPFESKAKELDKTNEQIILVLKEQAKTNPSLAEILKSLGLL